VLACKAPVLMELIVANELMITFGACMTIVEGLWIIPPCMLTLLVFRSVVYRRLVVSDPWELSIVVDGIEKVENCAPPCIVFPMESELTDTRGH